MVCESDQPLSPLKMHKIQEEDMIQFLYTNQTGIAIGYLSLTLLATNACIVLAYLPTLCMAH